MQGMVGLAYDEIFLRHVTPPGHPDRPERLTHLLSHLERSPIRPSLLRLPVTPADRSALETVHTARHIDDVADTCRRGGGMLDEGDTFASAASFDAALSAVGAVLRSIDAVNDGEVRSAFCAVRPPGHHAEADRPMGFCLFNTVAVGARYAMSRHGMERVAILDWDVHHGNGTQHIFEDDPSVLFISLHQYPFYPGSGARVERGIGAGEGFTVNIPLPAGTGEETYLGAFRAEVVPALQRFAPQLLLLSAGFDAHIDDPLASMCLTAGSYARMTALVRDVAPVVSVLEGGYNLAALASSVEAHLRALAS